MTTEFTKSKLAKEDVNFDTAGDESTFSIPTSTGSTRTGTKVNASHVPILAALRSLMGNNEDVNSALNWIVEQLAGYGVDATTSVKGIVELATIAEVQTGTDTSRAITPVALAGLTSTAVRRGLIELATQAEATAGSDAVRAITPATMKVVIDALIATHAAAADPHTAYGATAYYLHVRDEKAAGTNGGTFTHGAWRTRDLNTEVTNGISGASLASDQITLPAGTYRIKARVPAYHVQNHRAILYNITDTANELVGSTEVTYEGNALTSSIISGKFTIAGTKVFEIRHYGAVEELTWGFGLADDFSIVEVYTEVEIWKE